MNYLDVNNPASKQHSDDIRGDETGDGLPEWAVHQILHTMDYATDSSFWLHISNGLNLQVVHHLFPQVGWGHYKELSPIIREVCKEFGVKYSTQPTFWAAVVSHFKYLSCINDE